MSAVISSNSSERPAGLTLFFALIAGLVATLVFDLFGQWLSPTSGFARLAPAPLASQSLGVLFGEGAKQYGAIMHYVTGIVCYSLGYVLVARPIARAILPAIPWWIIAAAYGIVLWVFALYIMAHLVAGNPPFLGFSGITWVALVGHVVFTLALGGMLRALRA